MTFDYFTMHDTAWALLAELKEEFTRLVGVEFLQYVPQEHKLPFVVGSVFSTAAGREGVGIGGKREGRGELLGGCSRWRVFSKRTRKPHQGSSECDCQSRGRRRSQSRWH